MAIPTSAVCRDVGCRIGIAGTRIQITDSDDFSCPACGGRLGLLAHASEAAAAKRRRNAMLAAGAATAFVAGCAAISALLLWD
jgi:hypothetical protein